MNNIMILEDDRQQSDKLKRILESLYREGYIYQCYNLASATESIRDMRIDIVFVDLKLPDGTGYDFIKMLKEVQPTAWIIIVTGSEVSMEDELKVFKDKDCYDFLRKPIDVESVRDVVDQIYNKEIQDKDSSVLEITKKASVYRIPHREIVFIETIEKKTYIHYLRGGKLHKQDIGRVTLIRLTPSLDHRFMRIYKSIIVNKQYVEHAFSADRRWQVKMMYMDELLPMGKKYVAEFQLRFQVMVQ